MLLPPLLSMAELLALPGLAQALEMVAVERLSLDTATLVWHASPQSTVCQRFVARHFADIYAAHATHFNLLGPAQIEALLADPDLRVPDATQVLELLAQWATAREWGSGDAEQELEALLTRVTASLQARQRQAGPGGAARAEAGERRDRGQWEGPSSTALASAPSSSSSPSSSRLASARAPAAAAVATAFYSASSAGPGSSLLSDPRDGPTSADASDASAQSLRQGPGAHPNAVPRSDGTRPHVHASADPAAAPADGSPWGPRAPSETRRGYYSGLAAMLDVFVGRDAGRPKTGPEVQAPSSVRPEAVRDDRGATAPDAVGRDTASGTRAAASDRSPMNVSELDSLPDPWGPGALATGMATAASPASRPPSSTPHTPSGHAAEGTSRQSSGRAASSGGGQGLPLRPPPADRAPGALQGPIATPQEAPTSPGRPLAADPVRTPHAPHGDVASQAPPQRPPLQDPSTPGSPLQPCTCGREQGLHSPNMQLLECQAQGGQTWF